MTLTSDALDAWCPPTLTPLSFGRRAFAACTIEVANQRTRCSTSRSRAGSGRPPDAWSTGACGLVTCPPRERGRVPRPEHVGSVPGPHRGAPRRGRAAAQRFSASARKLRSRRLFVTTNTELKAIAAPAIIGLSSPAIASGSAATL